MSGKNKKAKNGLDPTVIVAFITVTGTILVALLNYDPIKTWWNARLNPTPTSSFIETFPPPPPELSTGETISIASPISIESATPFLTDTPLATQSLDVGEMIAQLTYNYAIGNIPLTITFNAQSSYVSYKNGTIDNCKFKNVCSYSWDVRQGGTPIYGPESGGSVFSYTFAKKGDYTIVVYVCRGTICNFAAASITAK